MGFVLSCDSYILHLLSLARANIYITCIHLADIFIHSNLQIYKNIDFDNYFYSIY